MKTAVSLPDELFKDAERTAHRSGISRSELYARAIRAYLAQTSEARLREEIRAFYGSETQEPDEFAREAARRTFERTEW